MEKYLKKLRPSMRSNMNDSELHFDKEKHILYSGNTKKILLDFINKEYGSEAEKVWEKVQYKYVEFLNDTPDYGGKKSPHAVQIYDSILLMSFCVAAGENHTLDELQPLAFKSANEKTNNHALKYLADFAAVIQPYDKENGIVRYSFTRCPLADFPKKHGLEKWLPLCCNCDQKEENGL